MCGIAGVSFFNGIDVDRRIIYNMANSMLHRGPDSGGVYIDKNIGLGHRRLSIIDLSPASNQPFTDAEGRYIVVFNGEIYNHNKIRKSLPQYPFKTTSDTETLVASFAKWGISCVDYFKGMFSFAIWDAREKELYIVRDRMGVKPLYYYLDDQKIVFSSEIRGILASGLVKREVSKKALFEYFSYQSVGSPFSIINGVEELGAGCYIKIKNKEINFKRYWDITECRKGEYENVENIRSCIRELLTESVRQRLISDVPVGAFLSGGIDSSTIVGLISEVSDARLNTFNVSFNETNYDESAYAQLVAKKFKTNHINIRLSPTTVLDELDVTLSAMDTPSGDGINTYLVSKAIKQAGITVALSGIGGDELFAGYPIFQQFKKLNKLKGIWNSIRIIRKALATFIESQYSSKLARKRSLLLLPSPDIEYIYPLLRQIISHHQLFQLVELVDVKETFLETNLKQLKGKLHKLPKLSQVSVAEYMGYTQNTLLKDTDQMSMAVSLEIREPFFDTDLVEYVLGIPDKFKQAIYPKSLLVESLGQLLPTEIVFRKKQGFEFPWKIWMKTELQDFCIRNINRICERGFINPKVLRDYWVRFLKNDESVRWTEIWLFVVLEYWLEKNGIEG